MANIKHSDIPFAIPPGETIFEELNARGQSVKELAIALGIDVDAGHALVTGQLEITPDLAAKLGTFFETSAAIWSNLESQYREALAEAKPAATEEAIAERQDVSGKFVVRVPKSLHVALKELAEAEGISLNQMVVAMLGEGLGRATVRLEPTGGADYANLKSGHRVASSGQYVQVKMNQFGKLRK